MRIAHFLIFLLAMMAHLAPTHAETHSQPVIGISGAAGDSKSVTAMMTMVRSLGATPMLIANHAEHISISGGVVQAVKDDLSMVDAVVVMGNNEDIDPATYGQQKSAHTKIETDTARRDYENALIKEVIQRKMPLLGICGGHQRINVLTGGTLHQHVPDMVGDEHHMQKDIPGFIPTQYIGIVEKSTLRAMSDTMVGLYSPSHTPLPQGVVMENSFHHQAVDRLGDGLRINAMSADGVIEGIEADPNGKFKDQFIMGVQWHPEFGASPLAPKLIGEVIVHAKGYGKEHPRTADTPEHNSYTETLLSAKNRNNLHQGSQVDRILTRRAAQPYLAV